MRFKTLILFFLLMLHLPLQAQDSEFSTLDALAEMDLPAFDYADMVDRMSWKNSNYEPPGYPPQYEIGDRDWFRLSFGNDGDSERIHMELRALTDRVLIWLQPDIDYPLWRAQALAKRIEAAVLDPMQKLFQFAEPPGVDGDPRLTVAMIHDPEGDRLGYFSPLHTRPRRLYSRSNQREMLVVNLALDEEYDFFDKVLLDVVAHEYLHVLQHHSDPGEYDWFNEAMASYAGYDVAENYFLIHSTHAEADLFLEAPDTSLMHWQSVEDKSPKYGAGGLFMIYLAERFGEDILPRLLAEQANGWQAVEKVLREYAGASADEVFADWVLANYFLDSRRGYGYRALEADLTPPQPVAGFNSFPAAYEGSLPQYSSDYLTVDTRGADKLLVRLWQAPAAQLIDEEVIEGDYFAYAVTNDNASSRLTRAFVLGARRPSWLRYRVWYDLEEELEYGYVMISDDNGSTWETLSGILTKESNVYSDFYTEGYTGQSGRWLYDRIDLSDYGPGVVMIRFEVMSNIATTYHGMAIDDLGINAIGFHEGFESPDDAWVADGWIRTDNRLPNKAWLQVVQENSNGLHLSRTLVTGNGNLTVELLPGVTQALVAVSPIVPHTSLPTDYELEFYLLDAAGEVMVVTRECTVTTTDFLNFRDAPNGNKIGLVPQGTAVDALDRQGDWFQVVYKGAQGWVSAGYVTAQGNCEFS